MTKKKDNQPIVIMDKDGKSDLPASVRIDTAYELMETYSKRFFELQDVPLDDLIANAKNPGQKLALMYVGAKRISDLCGKMIEYGQEDFFAEGEQFLMNLLESDAMQLEKRYDSVLENMDGLTDGKKKSPEEIQRQEEAFKETLGDVVADVFEIDGVEENMTFAKEAAVADGKFDKALEYLRGVASSVMLCMENAPEVYQKLLDFGRTMDGSDEVSTAVQSIEASGEIQGYGGAPELKGVFRLALLAYLMKHSQDFSENFTLHKGPMYGATQEFIEKKREYSNKLMDKAKAARRMGNNQRALELRNAAEEIQHRAFDSGRGAIAYGNRDVQMADMYANQAQIQKYFNWAQDQIQARLPQPGEGLKQIEQKDA